MVKNQNNYNTSINIDILSMDELLELNKRVISRMKELNSQKQATAALKFRMGDIVSFVKTDDNVKVVGLILSVRATKITILTETGKQWTVSPSLLSPEEKPSKKLLKLLDSIFPKAIQFKVSTRG